MNDPTALLEATQAFVQAKHGSDSSGHDWWHVDRVRRMALRLAAAEGADPMTVELAALLHDIADWKFHDGNAEIGPEAARQWLVSQQADAALIQAVCEIVAGVTFKGAGVATEMPTLEGKCVQDADRLDAIGAIGIGRAFAFGGAFGRAMYDPEISAQHHEDFTAYQKKSGPTLNHFPEKLFLLKDRLQTATAHRIAEGRHRFLEEFYERFLAEWRGDDMAEFLEC